MTSNNAPETKKPELRKEVRPRIINMWAKRYIDKLTKEGKESALEWANNFFNKKDLPAIAKRVKEMLRGRGL